jgi:small ligand-binding sensory domain FIST
MIRLPRGRTAMLLAVGLAAVAFQTSPAANHSWNGFHWARTANPFTVDLGDNLTSNWKDFLNIASSDWSQSTVLNTVVVAGQAKPRNCRPTAGRVEVCNATYGSTGWLGVAQVWISGSHITQGTVKVNDTYFSTATYNKPEWR